MDVNTWLFFEATRVPRTNPSGKYFPNALFLQLQVREVSRFYEVEHNSPSRLHLSQSYFHFHYC